MTNRSSQPDGHQFPWLRVRLRVAAVLAALATAALMTGACSGPSRSASEPTAPAATESATQSAEPSSAAETSTPDATSTGSASTTPSKPAPGATKLQIKDITVGKGAVAKAGDMVTVDYTGWLMDGSKFDSSIDRHQPFQFVLGKGDVIDGWDQGVAGMKVGGTRQLVVPPNWATETRARVASFLAMRL